MRSDRERPEDIAEAIERIEKYAGRGRTTSEAVLNHAVSQ